MDAKELSQGRALYERLHELMPADYPDAWVDLLETYKEKFAIAAIPTDAAQALEGWMLVPIEPTMEMVIDGFESCPSAIFSPQKDWEAFEAMSGCQQAAHKARLCYAAMLASAPVAPQAAGDAAALATQINRLRKDETRGDTVFRCGFNGAIDSVLKLLDGAAPVAPAAAAPITEAQRKAIDDAARVLGENWEHETADRLTEAFVASGASAAATSEPADWRGDFERKATVSGFDLSREESGGDYCHDRPAAAWLWYYSGRLDQACAAPTPTVAADAVAPR